MLFTVSWIDLAVGSQMQSTNASLNNIIANTNANCQAPIDARNVKLSNSLRLDFHFN